MAYSGFLFKFGNYTFPIKYIKWDTYDCAPNQRQDKDAYTDGNGLTHRNALPHTKTQVQFTTVKLSEARMDEVMSGLVGNYLNYDDRDAMCTYYDMENRIYKTGHMYIDPSLQFRVIGEQGGKLQFGETTFLFIEY